MSSGYQDVAFKMICNNLQCLNFGSLSSQVIRIFKIQHWRKWFEWYMGRVIVKKVYIKHTCFCDEIGLCTQMST